MVIIQNLIIMWVGHQGWTCGLRGRPCRELYTRPFFRQGQRPELRDMIQKRSDRESEASILLREPLDMGYCDLKGSVPHRAAAGPRWYSFL